MKEELYEMVVEVQRNSGRVMTIVSVFEEEVMRVLFAYVLVVRRSDCKKDQFCNEWQVNGISKILVKWSWSGRL